jgi:DNA-binding response OmpR family regulator
VSFTTPRRRALIVERQSALVPFLRDALTRAGYGAVTAARSASESTLRRSLPDTILLGPGMTSRPLDAIRRIRQARPDARIVAIAYRDDPLWNALAMALGADDVLGPSAEMAALERSLGGSIRSVAKARLRRTS